MMRLVSLPANVVNGIAVAVGVALVQAGFYAAAGPVVAQIAGAGAICASYPHLTDRTARAARRVTLGAVVATGSAAVILALRPVPIAVGPAVGALAFVLAMLQAWGKRAVPIAFSGTMAIVLTLTQPEGRTLASTLGPFALGALGYLVWAAASAWPLESRFRTLAVAASLRSVAALLRARAHLVVDVSSARWGLVAEEALLAERLQAARDLAFPAPITVRSSRDTAILRRTIELRETLLASRLDLELLGDDDFARVVRDRLSMALAILATALDALGRALRDGGRPDPLAMRGLDGLRELFSAGELPADDLRRRLLPAVQNRVGQLVDDVRRIEARLAGVPAEVDRDGQGREALQRFVADDSWPLSVPLGSLTPSSPIFRFAVRSGLAVSAAYYLGLAMPGAHPFWLVMSVAVVLRGTLDQTVARRNERVVGTAIGCAVVLLLVELASDALLRPLVPAALGASHAFVAVRYVLTAASSTVMSLLQAHLVAPAGTRLAAGERLLDTALGALLAWGFSYVLPSWERRTLPTTVGNATDRLRAYATVALGAQDGVEQRLARQRAYDALEAVAATLRRIAYEPSRVRGFEGELVVFLDHALRLMAHLSAVRLLLVRRSVASAEASAALGNARAAIEAALTADAGMVELPAAVSLPAEPVEQVALPWLSRRLRAAERDAVQAAQAARSALELLDALTRARS